MDWQRQMASHVKGGRETRGIEQSVEYSSTDVCRVDEGDWGESEDEDERPGRSSGSVDTDEALGRAHDRGQITIWE